MRINELGYLVPDCVTILTPPANPQPLPIEDFDDDPRPELEDAPCELGDDGCCDHCGEAVT